MPWPCHGHADSLAEPCFQGLSILYLYAASVAKHDGALMVRSPVHGSSALHAAPSEDVRPWATGTVKAYLCQKAAVRLR